jgi:CheY-like chemotaxis protein
MTKVLVIDDEEILLESILEILTTRGFSAVGAADGRHGLQLAKELVPDVILCDVRMPEVNGYEVLKAVREDSLTATIPFIFLTAENKENVLRQGKVFGANGCLAKPFTTAELLGAISPWLRDR